MKYVLLALCLFVSGAWTHGAPVATPYTGFVATRGSVPVFFNTGATTNMIRSMHFMRAPGGVTSLQIIVPNFYVNTLGNLLETATGSATTETASVEYPAGTCTQIKFSGAASGTVPNGGTLVSDPVTVAIPNTAQFWIRQYQVNASGFYYGFSNSGNPSNGDFMSSSQGDVTVSCGTQVTDNYPGYTQAPMAIIGTTTAPSILGIGTSRMAGLGDTQDSSGDMGPLMRSIGPVDAYVNLGVPSDKYSTFISSHTNRLTLFQYATTVVFECPINDFNGNTLAQLESLSETMYGYATAAGKLSQAYSCDPYTSGAWTLANQSDQTLVFNLSALNGYILSSPSPLNGSHDITTVTEKGIAGYWNGATGSLCPGGWTPDGVHETQCTNYQIQASGVLSPYLFIGGVP